MGQNQENFKRGTAELLVLHLLQKEDLYGYQIIRYFEEKSGGEYLMLESSLYPILYKLTQAGFITDYVKQVGVRRTRRYYHIEDSGREYYKEILNDYLTVQRSIDLILDREIKNEE